MIRHYVARRAQVIEDHPHNAAVRVVVAEVAWTEPLANPARVNGTAARRMAWQTGQMVLFCLNGEVSSENLSAIQTLLAQLTGGQVTAIPAGLHVEGAMEGSDAREVNRRLLSALRRAERRTRLRAEWTAGGTTYRFFDYVPKSERPA
jgi:hypothetical protein